MSIKASGPWAQQIVDETSLEQAELESSVPSGAEPQPAVEHAKDDLRVLGVFQQGGSSGSGLIRR